MMGDMKSCCVVHKIAWVLVMVGAINWGLVGIGMFMKANWNLVNMLLGSWPQVEWAVYILVGVSAVAMLFKDNCKQCRVEMKKM
jgi:uncharacterized membrane protein YuzA (DUF378 family)